MKTFRIERFLDEFTQWAAAHEEVLALALVGSHARSAATEASDVDLVMIILEPTRYLQDINWLKRFGEIERHQFEDYGLLKSIRVWYQDGLEVEYGLTDERWAAMPLDAGTRQVIADGMRVLFERENILSRHISTQPPL
jgi:predicted nucleotidyltransferase